MQYCMGKWGYNKVVPALSIRPPLLSRNLVSALLSSTLESGARSLRYAVRIPVTTPKPYPPKLRDWSVPLMHVSRMPHANTPGTCCGQRRALTFLAFFGSL